MKELIQKLKSNIKSHDLSSYSAQCAYYLLLSFFPFIIIIIMVLTNFGYEYVNTLIDGFDKLPKEVITLLKEYFNYSNKFSSLAFSPLIITILLMSLKAMDALMRALNIVNNVTEKRNFFYKKLLSLISLLIILTMIILSIYVTSINIEGWLTTIVNFLILTISISTLYYMLPDTKRQIVEILPGSFFSSILLILTVYTFGYFITNFTKYSVIYGSMSSIIMLLIMMFLFAFILMLGEELNVLVKKDD